MGVKGLILYVTLLLGGAAGVFAENARFLLTGDLQGRVYPCTSCPHEKSEGGLVHVAAAVESVKKSAEGDDQRPWLLDAGNAFTGGDLPPDAFRTLTDLYRLAGMDAMNISFRDFRHGADFLMHNLLESELPVVSANVVAAAGGERLFAASRLLRRSSGREATVIGLTEPPPGRKVLPHLRQQLDGVDFIEPAEALREQLENTSPGDQVVVLYYGGPAGLRSLQPVLEAFADRTLQVGAAGVGEREVPDGMAVTLAVSEGRGLRLSGVDPERGRIGLSADLPDDPEMEAVLRERNLGPYSEQRQTESPSEAEPLPSGKLTSGLVDPAIRSVSHRGLTLRVHQMELLDSLEGEEVSEGSLWLRLDCEFENNLAMELILEKGYPEPIQVASLSRELYLVVNHRKVRTHVRPLNRFSLTLPERFVMRTIGDRVRGHLVFEVPETDLHALSLRYYHAQFPPLVLPLAGAETDSGDEALQTGISPNQMEVGVFGTRREEVWRGQPAPPGMEWLIVDIRGRGLRTGEMDAVALAADADPGQRVEVPLVSEYLRAPELLQVVVDGGDAYVRDPSLSTLEPEPAFLPDVTAGGQAVFPIPEAARHLEVAFDFPEFSGAPGAAQPIPIRVVLTDSVDIPEAPEPIAVIEDDPLPLSILGGRLEEEGRELLVDVSISNTGETGGLYEAAGRGRLRLANGEFADALGAELRGGIPLPEAIWIPANNEPRRFSYRFQLPPEAEDGLFAYSGVSRAGQLQLTFSGDALETGPLEGAEVESAASDPSSGSWNEDEFVQHPIRSPEKDPVDVVAGVYSETLESTPPESRIELDVTGENNRLRITASHAYVFTQTEEGDLPEEETMVGVHFRIERRETVEEPFTIRFLKEHLFAVSRFSKLHPLISDTSLKPQIPHRFELTDDDPFVEGIALFKVKTSRLSHFELHWVDEEFGNFELPILPVGEGRIESPDPVFAGQNAITEMGVYGMELRESYREQSVENGRWLVLDLRGRSVRQTPGGVGTRLSWRDWMQRTQLIVDGDQVFDLNRHQTDIEEPFLMLPGRAVGGEIAFQVPDEVLASAQSIEWVAGFGAYAVPGDRVRTPEPIRIQLKGKRPESALPGESLAEFEDEDFDFYVLRVERPDTFMGEEGRRWHWVVAEVAVRAKAEAGVTFRPLDVLQLVNPTFEYYNPGSIVWGGSDQQESRESSQWIAPGDVRRFKMAWRLRSEHTPHRLRYRGVRKYQTIPLGEDFPLKEGDAPVDPGTDRHISEKGLRVLYPDRTPEGIAGVDLEPQQVNSAIDRGQAYLWKEIRDELTGRGRVHRMSYIYPMLYALVNTELHVENAEFDGVLRDFLDQVRPQEQTIYENGLLAMILRAYGDPDYAETLKQTVHYFVEAQGENGTWSYRAETPDRFFVREEPVESADGLLIAGGENPEEAAEKLEDPVYRTQSFTLGTEGDNSCTQFAVLGLWSAQRAGIQVDPDVWRRVLRSATDFQNYRNTDAFGGYTYGRSGSSYGSMTAAVLCTTALALRRLDPEVNVAEHLRIRNALGWLAENFSVQINPEKKRYNYYYLYSLERVGQILGTEFIGDYEWYPLGARYLVDAQNNDGSWPEAAGETDPHLTTAYALLFLTRATPKMDEDLTPDPDEPGKLLTRLQRPDVQNRVYLILDASGSMRDGLQGREKFGAAREAIGDMLEAMPENTEVALRVYGHRLRAIEEGADEDSELVLGWGPLDVPAFKQTLRSLTPMGKTPLSLSLTEAAGQVASRRGEGQTVLVLLTDGGESDRFADPVEAARAFAEKEEVQFFVLGFDINREDWTRQLRDMAEAGKGVYRPVEDANVLTRELISVVYPPAPRFDFVNDEGEIVESGALENREFSLKPGKYTLTLKPGREELKQTVWIRPGGTTRIQYTLGPTRTPVRTAEVSEESPTESETTRPAFCTQCGSPLGETTRFCTKCGARVAD